jgi:hypothetical protein
LAFPTGSALLPKHWGGFRSAGWSGRPRVALVTEPLLQRRMPVRAVHSSPSGPEGPSGLGGTPLMGFKDHPSADTNAVRPLPGGPKPAFRPGGANLRTRSVLAVPPDSDGFLRSAPCRSIAPCNRPWGSPCFGYLAVAACRRRRRGTVPDGAYPPKLFPPWQLYRVTTASALSLLVAAAAGLPDALPRLSGPFSQRPQPQGFEPPRSPLLAPWRCRRDVARCSLGLLILPGCSAWSR